MIMGKRVGIEVSLAVAEAVRACDADVIAAYPITPQTHIVERLSEMVANGELDADSICVESEHSAMSACLGSAASGARTFTATAGQGLELMHEVVFVAASMRLPIVMAVANRALSSPLSVWGDHSDVMAVRDTGWIQIFCENGQDAFDLIVWAFRVAEDKRVLFPVMVNLDGFHLTHVVEPITIYEKEEVAKFLPPNKYPTPLDPRKPVNMGAFGPPAIYTEVRKSQEVAFENTMPVIKETLAELEKHFGRKYEVVEKYKMDGAETALLTMGSFSQTAMEAIDELRAKGKKIGLIRIRLWRPFPAAELVSALKGVKTLAILDRAVSFGSGSIGPVACEVRSVLYPQKDKPFIVSFIGGLGGRDIYPEDFVAMIEKAVGYSAKGSAPEYEMIGVRE
jgi:pyruvate ferredoxin oxidoreductase alpha subunit